MDEQEKIYKKYCDNCHREGIKGFSAELLEIPDKLPYWTSRGTIDAFEWRALTTVFSPQEHFINEKKERYNQFHMECTHHGGIHLLDLILDSIGTDPVLSTIIYDMYVINTGILLAPPDNIFLDSLVEGMRTCSWNTTDALYVEGNSLRVHFEKIQNQNLVFPLPFASRSYLDHFSEIATPLIKSGANSCVAICVTWPVPNERGETANLPKEMGFPLIKGISFREMCGL